MSTQDIIEGWERGVEPYMLKQQEYCVKLARKHCPPQYHGRANKTRPAHPVGPKKGIPWLALNLQIFNQPKQPTVLGK